jgi:asparagine synthase (glutamine-hydrolysing)
MCGIAGIWNLNGVGVPLESLQRFTDSISHRGPDGAGYELLFNNALGFGHRRLSILDLTAAGKQPMYSREKDLVITFNGEVYNFIEIRNELKELGEAFHTETDTEVILRAYKRWGKNAFQKFNGMFAIAIWDSQKEELLLLRDRFGIKPLYYLYIPGVIFAFASETLAFKYLDGYKRQINEKTFNLALQRPALLEGSEKTIYQNIYQLLPGSFLTMTQNESPQTKKWWETHKHFVKVPATYSEQVEQFKALFEDACKLRMRSDVSLASALSGGLDSSSVYCTLHKINQNNSHHERIPGDWQRAFVATFPNTSVDERQYAEQVVKHVNGKATYIVPDYKNLLSDVIKATRLFDGIIMTPITSIADVYKAMRAEGITVSLDGHGVDEMMYGYNSYVFEAFYEAIKNRDWKKAEDFAKIISGLSPAYKMEDLKKTIRQFNKNVVEKGFDLVKRKLNFSQRSGNSSTVMPWAAEPDHNLINDINLQHYIPTNFSSPEKMMYEDFHYRSLPINLRDFDRASMQHGIEIRMPFMDYRLVSYVFSLPRESKIGGGFTKRILRDAMKNTLPESIRTRTLKIGIGAPMEEWFNNELKTYVQDTVRSESFYNSPYWNGKQVKEDLDKAYENKSLDKNFCSKAWGLLNAHIILNG